MEKKMVVKREDSMVDKWAVMMGLKSADLRVAKMAKMMAEKLVF